MHKIRLLLLVAAVYGICTGISFGIVYFACVRYLSESVVIVHVRELLSENQKLQKALEREREYKRELTKNAQQILRVNPEAPSMEIAAQIAVSSEKWGVDADLIIAMGAAESGWDVNARGAAGEVGPLQVMPETLEILRPGADPADWQVTLDAGVEYLSRCLERANGDIRTAIAFYNAGASRGPERALRLASRHVYRVMQYRRRLQCRDA